ncbi:SPOR domain-containing protein [Celeribacter arenosi]|uniref:SPOR domain-containing protein n=1 Tax=Celeribacter arenosi TaxID=792649 RepID=A0ABP7JU77_9RHOB
MTQKTWRLTGTAALLMVTTIGLSGCEEGQSFKDAFAKKPTTEGSNTGPSAAGGVIEKDVEAPDVFQVTDRGLWDGRPSLGGVWIAHSDVSDPERVIIRNEANGQSVIGALFKRETTAPGPALQVSSDTAEALGMLAGAPVELSVTALRREEVAIAPAPAPMETETLDAPEAIETAPLDPIADAAATLDAIEAGTPTAPMPKPAAPAPVTTSTLSKPYLQIGIFSVEANARRTVEMLASQGVTAEVKSGNSNGKSFWRVVVGPASTAGARADLLAKVKATGFTDAYAVTH